MKLSSNLKIAVVMLAAFGTISGASAASDPTSGRLGQREYQKCVNFSKTVLQAALSQSGGDRAKINSAYSHYYGNVERCRSRFL